MQCVDSIYIVVEDVGEFVVENVRDAVEFFVVFDRFEDIFSVFVYSALEDHVFFTFFFAVFVDGYECLIDGTFVFQRAEQGK